MAEKDEQAEIQQEPDQSGESEGNQPTSVTTAFKPSLVFLGVVAAVSLVADLVTKAWAVKALEKQPLIVLVEDVLAFRLAYNRGGAFGMLASQDGEWRRPFFLIVSVAASVFIISLYRKVTPQQRTLKWGLPLVLGGALGNFADRLTQGKVVDFIDYQAGWVETMNELIQALNSSWHVTRHWPTFNVADICICVGVGLMALDMLLNRSAEPHQASSPPGASPQPD